MGVLYVAGVVLVFVELAAAVAIMAIALPAASAAARPRRTRFVILLNMPLQYGLGVGAAFALASPLHALSAWPGGWFSALVLPALVLGVLRQFRFAVGCGLVHMFWIPDHRLVALFVGPILLISLFRFRLGQILSLLAFIPFLEESTNALVEIEAQTPAGKVLVPVRARHALASTVGVLTYAVTAGPTVAALWAAPRLVDRAWAPALILLGLASTALSWWTLRQTAGVPRIHRLTQQFRILFSVALAWIIAAGPVGAVLVSYWRMLDRYYLQFAVPLLLLLGAVFLNGPLVRIQQRTVDGWAPMLTRAIWVVVQGRLFVLLTLTHPDPVVTPSAAVLSAVIVLIQVRLLARFGLAWDYRPVVADLYRAKRDMSAQEVGLWVHDAVLRRPKRPDLTLPHRFLTERFAALTDDKFGPTVELQRLFLISAGRGLSDVPSRQDYAERWLELYEMARGGIEAAAITGNPHPAVSRRYTILCASAAELDVLIALRRGRYADMLAATRSAAGLWVQADLPCGERAARIDEVYALLQVGRHAEAEQLTSELCGTLDGYHLRELWLVRARWAVEHDLPADFQAGMAAMAGIRVTRRDRRSLRKHARITRNPSDGWFWIGAARRRVRAQARRETAAGLFLSILGEQPVHRRYLRAALHSVPRKGVEWYVIKALSETEAGHDLRAYRHLSRSVALARRGDETAMLQRALHMRAAFLSAHGVMDGAVRDLYAAIAAQEDIRDAAMDAAARIAAGGTAAHLYEYATEQVLAARADRPARSTMIEAGDVGSALDAYVLSELSRSRELVRHLAETWPSAESATTVADRLESDHTLGEQAEELGQQLQAARGNTRRTIANQRQAALRARDAVWSRPADEAADLAELRKGRVIDYDEVRALLATTIPEPEAGTGTGTGT
jgi:hypothetical protein